MERDELMATFPHGGETSDHRKAREDAQKTRCEACSRSLAHCICQAPFLTASTSFTIGGRPAA